MIAKTEEEREINCVVVMRLEGHYILKHVMPILITYAIHPVLKTAYSVLP